MSQLINSYPIFEGNQVLTSSQLNQMAGYLDEQNRLTRVKLIGSGVVCGMDIDFRETENPQVIALSKGLGITSEGYLMGLGECELNRYRPYNLPSGVTYLPFVDPETRQQDVELFELIGVNKDVINNASVNFLNVPIDFLSDKVVMLFYECVDDDLKSCLGKSCDDRGLKRTFTLRKLLVSISELENKIIPRTCVPDQQNNAKYNLPRFIIGEPKFQPNTPQSTSYNEFSQNYVNQIMNTTFVSDFVDSNTSLYNALFDALRQTYTDFATILAPVYNSVNPFEGLPSLSWTSFLNQDSAGPRYLGVQYFYDFIKDLILAYNEFYDAAFELLAACCQNMNCFPKHLLLGEVISNGECSPSKYRNYFTPSQAIAGNKDSLDRLLMLHKRMVLMTRKFNLSIINNPSSTPVPPSTLGQPVLITPSNEKRDPLSMRSIPYYYLINEEEAGLGSLEQNWSYAFIKECLFKHGLEPLGYGNQNVVQTVNAGPVRTPLYFDSDPFNFLRIEGAIRQNYIDVEDELKRLRSMFNLPFNVLTVRLAGAPFDNIKERCNFDDLRTQYLMLRIKLKEMTCSLFDRIAIENQTVQLKPLPVFLTSLIQQTGVDSIEKGSIDQPQVGFTFENQDVCYIPDSEGVYKSGVAHDYNRRIPIFAERRNMNQAVSYYQSNLLELAQKLYAICEDLLPFDFNTFDFGYTGKVPNQIDGFIQTYLDAKQLAINISVSQNQILDLVERSNVLANPTALLANLATYFESFQQPLNSFIGNNDYMALTTLYYLYENRITYLEANDFTLFSNFIKKHPGVTHQAGVPKGGTFILVVTGNPVEISQATVDYAISINNRIRDLEVSLARSRYSSNRSTFDAQRVQRQQSEMQELLAIQNELSSNVPVAQDTNPILIDGDQVIADFTLPYLINCDCTCDEIPVPTEETMLNMPALTTPFVAQYSLGDYAYAGRMQRSVQSGLMYIDVSDALLFDTNVYTDSNVKLSLVTGNGSKVNYNFEIPPAGQSMQQDLMPTYNHPNDPGNAQQYGTAGIAYQNGKWSLTYRAMQGFTGIDSFYYTFELIDPTTGALLQNGTKSVVTVDVSG